MILNFNANIEYFNIQSSFYFPSISIEGLEIIEAYVPEEITYRPQPIITTSTKLRHAKMISGIKPVILMSDSKKTDETITSLTSNLDEIKYDLKFSASLIQKIKLKTSIRVL